ncbi:MAG TPA: class I SAM-dependent methyltransferase, partial [Casimicrobiaceae bacterium]|nr:class I SAM-dependent methyltransferase [Casimicrobiaceae bacterium]
QVRDGVRLEITSLATALDATARAHAKIEQAARDLHAKHESLRRRLAEVAPEFPTVGGLCADDSAAWFHAAVEGTFRGSVDEIRARLCVYLPYLSSIPTAAESHLALDLGCGRGEWLTLLRDHRRPAIGVDANPVSVERCMAAGLQAVRADVIEYLRAQQNGSASLITAFHLVEHLPVESLVAMLVEVHRVLAPGGLLLVETPNADNLAVGASSFYLDPTHRHPLPAPLLRLILGFAKFEVIETLWLQPDETLRAIAEREGWPETLTRLLAGPRDAGIIARKAAGADASAAVPT